jgi:hypothetical protein
MFGVRCHRPESSDVVSPGYGRGALALYTMDCKLAIQTVRDLILLDDNIRLNSWHPM